jgi:hypothetical protein
MLDPLAYYSPETYLFPKLGDVFTTTGQLDPEALYLILDWKASRARTRHLRRLTSIAGSFVAAAQEIAADLHMAAGPQQQLGILLTKWGFRLPTATAILTVLYPNTFSIYDVRVCHALNKFRGLDTRRWSTEVWEHYQQFIVAVRDEAAAGLTLRDCDRWLWGRDKQRVMKGELGIRT